MLRFEVKQLKSDSVAPQPDYFKRRAILNIIVREAKLINDNGSEFKDNLFEDDLGNYLNFIQQEGLIFAYAVDWTDDNTFVIKVKIEEDDKGENDIIITEA